jgi:hypothetical protein
VNEDARSRPAASKPAQLPAGGGGYRATLAAISLIPFVVLATFNSAGYRYGASDQAFYLPAVLDRLNPALFPRDSDLIASQATLTLVDDAIAALARAVPVSLPVLFGILYVVALAFLVWGALSIAGRLYRTRWAAVALLAALTLRHAITKTGANTLEGYFHPRQLAFGFGILALAAFLRRGLVSPVLLLLGAAIVHPTTALWFIAWLGVAVIVVEPRLRAPLALVMASGAILGVWALIWGPLIGRLEPMDPAWLDTLASKDYLFPLEWPAHAWLLNLAYAPLIVWIHRRRRAAGVLDAREKGLVAGCLSLVAIFAAALMLHPWHIALAIQLQPARVFWMLDFLATVYVVWLLAEGPNQRPRRAAAIAGVLVLLSAARSAYVAVVRFPERSFATLDIPDDDWGRVMAWARSSTPVSGHWLADPVHAALYGTSVRVAGHKDVFVEEIKDSAIGMYSRTVAMRTRERMEALGGFGGLSAADARDLSARYGLDYLVTERPLELPVAFRSGPIVVYQLR